jgi:hypothetical protein
VYEHKEFSSSRDFKRDRTVREFKQYTGVLTPFAKKKLKRAIGLMVASAVEKEAPNFKTGKTYKFKVNFLTFTLPAIAQGIEDKTIKRCLDNWIKRAKRKHNLKSYVWRAERQANGNIHFHMVTDVWIHYEKIRDDWNAVLKETGLVEKYTQKHRGLTFTEYLKLYPVNAKVSRVGRLKSYEKGCATKWEQPNSTDVHAVWKVKNLTQYFVKYMSKEHKEGEEPIKGKVWDCSENLKTKENCWMLLEGRAAENFDYLAKKEDVERINDPLFTILFVSPEKWEQYLCKEVRDKWNEYLKRIRNGSAPPGESEA